jgi:hypothetical protein
MKYSVRHKIQRLKIYHYLRLKFTLTILLRVTNNFIIKPLRTLYSVLCILEQWQFTLNTILTSSQLYCSSSYSHTGIHVKNGSTNGRIDFGGLDAFVVTTFIGDGGRLTLVGWICFHLYRYSYVC